MDPIRTKLALTAFYYRLIIILLALIFNLISRDLIAENIFTWKPAPNKNDSTTYSDRVIEILTSGLTRADGQFYLHVANHGYTYENTLAYFPLYPCVIKLAGDFVYWLQVDYGLIHVTNALALASILVNILCFVVATLVLFELSRKVLRDDFIAYKSALFFCINPANIYFTATYAESLYSMLTFFALLKLEKNFSVKVALAFIASVACRFNGFVSLGFVLYKGLKSLFREIIFFKKLKELKKAELSETIVNIIGDCFIPTFTTIFVAIVPLVLFQWYSFTQFCGIVKPKNDYDPVVYDYAMERELKMPSAEPSLWCNDWIPIPYFYIQDRYWNIGFFRHFSLRILPNFCLIAPLLYIVSKHCNRFFLYHRRYNLNLGCVNIFSESKKTNFNMYICKILPRECFAYVVHLTFITLYCVFFVHPQVTLRTITSSSPVIYWIAALICTPPNIIRAPSLPNADFDREEIAAKLETKENLNNNYLKHILFDEPMLTNDAKLIKGYFCFSSLFLTMLFVCA